MNPIRTWRERAGLTPDYPLDCATVVERAMVEEIAELCEVLGFKDQENKTEREA